jgi:hypothetical protein
MRLRAEASARGAAAEDRGAPLAVWAVAILAVAVAVKLPYVWVLHGRFYPDVDKAVNFGSLLARGVYDAHTDVISNKTFLGPILCFRLWELGGANALVLLNLAVVLAVCWAQYALGRDAFDARTRLAALLLLAFYTGTNRNVIAGEPEDSLAALCIALGVLWYVRRDGAWLAGLLLGVGSLFKYWVAIFGLGFVAALAARRRWEAVVWLGAGMAAPLALLSAADGGESVRGIFISARHNQHFAGWTLVIFKMLSTGMLVFAPAAAWAWWRRRDERRTLFFSISVAFPVYMVLTAHAWPANFVLMACLVFSGFLVAEAVLAALDAARPRWRRPLAAALALAWIAVTTALTSAYLDTATVPIQLVPDRGAAQKLFPYNAP